MGTGLKRALISAAVYFLVLFALGFVLGTVRVVFVIPRFGQLAATLAELPVMLVAAYFICHWVLRHWLVPWRYEIRWAMVLLFLVLLGAFETLLGLMLGRTLSDQWAALLTYAGLLGLLAQVIAGLLPVFVGRDVQTQSV